MLNSYDIESMKRDVNGIIGDWSDTVEIWKLLPDDQQPGWNPLMREVSGDKIYDKRTNITVERRDVHVSELESNQGGDRYTGVSVLCVPDDIPVDHDCIFILAGDTTTQWRVHAIKDRLGENMVTIFKL